MTPNPSNLLECHGRLCRSDGRPANPGNYRLYFSLHRDGRNMKELWAETVESVEVAPGGFYHIVLGEEVPLSPTLFGAAPLFLATRVMRGEKLAPESTHRVPVLALSLRNNTVLGDVEDRLRIIEARLFELGLTDRLGNRTRRADRGAFPEMQRAVDDLLERVGRVEVSGDRFEGSTDSRLGMLETRATLLDHEDTGRVTRLEDEIGDIIGPDGDVVDLNDRMDRVESIAGLEGLATGLPIRAPSDNSVTDLERRLINVETLVADLPDEPGSEGSGSVTADTLRVVKRSGDVMTGGLTINRGGLEVKSGGIIARSGALSSLSVENTVRTERLIADGVELRGDLTVDNPRRVLQIRGIEGRKGSAREDGPLHLNSRGGDPVLVGNADAQSGLVVHGTTASNRIGVQQSGCAEVFQTGKSLIPGTVVCLAAGGKRKVQACRTVGDPRLLGVVVESAGLLSGDASGPKAVCVALFGTADCCVEADSGPVEVGDLLTPSNVTGHARRVDPADVQPGALLGKALAPLKSGRGVIPIVVMVR